MDLHQVDRHFDLLKTAGVPKSYRLWSLKEHHIADPRQAVVRDDENTAAQQVCDAATPESWVVLAGSVGTGKTTFATATFNDMVAKRVSRNAAFGNQRPPKWVTEARFLRMASVAGAAGYHGRAAYVGSMITCPILVMDDLGGQRTPLTNWGAGAIRDIFDERYSNEKPTILTTNLATWDDLAGRYGDHIA
jgi:DNA replication protein DnaC